MLQRVRKNLKEWNMVSSGNLILAGVSGGADSLCLLLMLDALKEEMDFSLEVVHVEHGIRGQESLDDAAFVEDLCKAMHIVCHKVTVNVPAYSRETGLGTEEAARILRYQAFSNVAKAARENGKTVKVALAHHMEDNAETILFQMVRGSSLTGLCGMQPVREDEDGMVYIRPLLSLHRNELEEYLELQGQAFRVDSTNEELDYHRNYLRNEVLPKLASVNNQAVAHINQSAAHLSLVKDYLDKEVEVHWMEIAHKDKDGLSLNAEKLLGLHLVLQQEIAYRAIGEMAGGKKDISSVHVEDLLDLCKNQSGKELHLPKGILAKKEYERILLRKKDDTLKLEDEVKDRGNLLEKYVSKEQLETLRQTGDRMEISLGKEDEKLVIQIFSCHGKSAQIPQKPYTKWLDYDNIREGFCIRTRQSGDYFISDKWGHHKKLKQYFIDEKISSADRESMWLLAQENLVLWLIGGRISEHIKVTEDTKTIVEIKYMGGT